MTVASTISKARYVAAGGVTAYPVTFRFTDPDELAVYHVPPGGGETLLTLGTDYTVSAPDNDYNNGGTVTLSAVPVDGTVIVILRRLELVQLLDLQTNGSLPPESLELGFDRLTMMMQQLAEEQSRCVKFNPTSLDDDDPAPDEYMAALQGSVAAAVIARDGAEAAQSAAEDAQTGAEEAKTGAETAQGAAEDAAEAAENAVTDAHNAAVAAVESLFAGVCNGRLTLASGQPIPAGDVTAATTLYWTPCNGSAVSLYDGEKWVLFTVAEISLDLSGLTASTI